MITSWSSSAMIITGLLPNCYLSIIKMSSSIIISVDQIVWPSTNCVQYRGRGYSNRFLHSAEVAHFTHTMDIRPTKLVYLMTLLPYHRHTPRVMSWVSPVSPHDTCHLVAKLSQTGTLGPPSGSVIKQLGSQDYRRLPDQGSTHA